MKISIQELTRLLEATRKQEATYVTIHVEDISELHQLVDTVGPKLLDDPRYLEGARFELSFDMEGLMGFLDQQDAVQALQYLEDRDAYRDERGPISPQ